MGLEDFNDPNLEEGDTYYLAQMEGEARVKYPGLYEVLPSDIKDSLHRDAEPDDGVCIVDVRFSVEGRGYNEGEAYNAAKAKIENPEDHDFNNSYAEVIWTGIVSGTDRIIKKEFSN